MTRSPLGCPAPVTVAMCLPIMMAGLLFCEETYGVEGDLLVVPAKRRRSPRPASSNGYSYRSDTRTPLVVIEEFRGERFLFPVK